MAFKIGDICVGTPGSVEDGMVVIDVSPTNAQPACTVISLSRKRIYKLAVQGLIKIGELSADMDAGRLVSMLTAPPPVPDVNSAEYVEGKRRAEKEAAYEQNEFRRQWLRLAEARPGEFLPLCMGGGKHQLVTFHHVLARGEKYVFVAATRRGKVYRYPIAALMMEPEHVNSNRPRDDAAPGRGG